MTMREPGPELGPEPIPADRRIGFGEPHRIAGHSDDPDEMVKAGFARQPGSVPLAGVRAGPMQVLRLKPERPAPHFHAVGRDLPFDDFR
jgi:hypothetical protein